MNFYERLPSCTQVIKNSDGSLVWCFPEGNVTVNELRLDPGGSLKDLVEVASCAELAGFGQVLHWLVAMKKDTRTIVILPVPDKDCLDET
jgi:hypothetical protein